jgi:hypothetical protein
MAVALSRTAGPNRSRAFSPSSNVAVRKACSRVMSLLEAISSSMRVLTLPLLMPKLSRRGMDWLASIRFQSSIESLASRPNACPNRVAISALRYSSSALVAKPICIVRLARFIAVVRSIAPLVARIIASRLAEALPAPPEMATKPRSTRCACAPSSPNSFAILASLTAPATTPSATSPLTNLSMPPAALSPSLATSWRSSRTPFSSFFAALMASITILSFASAIAHPPQYLDRLP